MKEEKFNKNKPLIFNSQGDKPSREEKFYLKNFGLYGFGSRRKPIYDLEIFETIVSLDKT